MSHVSALPKTYSHDCGVSIERTVVHYAGEASELHYWVRFEGDGDTAGDTVLTRPTIVALQRMLTAMLLDEEEERQRIAREVLAERGAAAALAALDSPAAAPAAIDDAAPGE